MPLMLGYILLQLIFLSCFVALIIIIIIIFMIITIVCGRRSLIHLVLSHVINRPNLSRWIHEMMSEIHCVDYFHQIPATDYACMLLDSYILYEMLNNNDDSNHINTSDM